MWTMDFLRQLVAHREGIVKFHYIHGLATALSLRWLFLCQPLGQAQWHKYYVGDPEHPTVPLLSYPTCLVNGQPCRHFDALALCDDMNSLNFRELRAATWAAHLQAKKHMKRIHLLWQLRAHQRLPLLQGPMTELKAEQLLTGPIQPVPVPPRPRRAVSNGLSILQWNVESLSVRLPELRRLLDTRVFHVVCLQECWHRKEADLPRLCSLNGQRRYQLAAHTFRSASKGGGTACYVLSPLTYHCETTVKTDNTCEITAVTVELRRIKTMVANVYLPPPASAYAPDDSWTEACLSHLMAMHPEVICGGFNAPAGSVRWHQLTELIGAGDLGHYDSDEPTSLRGHAHSRPDGGFFADSILGDVVGEVLLPGSSDHRPLTWTLGHPAGQRRPRAPRRWRLKGANYAAYRQVLDKAFTELGHNLEHLEPIAAYNLFVDIIMAGAKKCFRRTAPKGRARAFWNSECQAAKDAVEACSSQVAAALPDDKGPAMEALTAARRHLRHVVAQARQTSWHQFANTLAQTPESKDGSSRAFAVLRGMSGKRPAQKFPALVHGHRRVHHGHSRAQLLVRHHGSVCRNPRGIAHHIRSSNKQDLKAFQQWSSSSSSPPTPWSKTELKRAIRLLRPGKAGGIDLIAPEFILQLPHDSIRFLLEIFNGILRTNHLPSSWTKTLLVPLVKPGRSGTSPDHYRYIGLTPVLLKVYENMVLHRLASVMPPHSPLQFGFVSQRSAEQNLALTSSYVSARLTAEQLRTRGYDQALRAKACATKIDFHKAFDKVQPWKLLSALRLGGAQVSCVRFLRQLFSRRMMKVTTCIGNSSWVRQRLGLVQGSILGPHLWAWYIDDLLRELSHAGITAPTYADDITPLTTGFTIASLEATTTKAYSLVQVWARRMHQPIAPSKSAVLLFSMHPQEKKLHLNVVSTGPSGLLCVEVLVDCPSHGLPQGFRRNMILYQHDEVFYQVTAVNKQEVYTVGELRAAWTIGVNKLRLQLVLPTVRVMTLLGVDYEGHLTFQAHVGRLKDKVAKMCAWYRELHGATWGPDIASPPELQLLLLSEFVYQMARKYPGPQTIGHKKVQKHVSEDRKRLAPVFDFFDSNFEL